uniref:Importin N-terminal domain-containing protein n=1 Tax=Clastoptera arizonana TaxID=38151 RepID=A0A1B6DUV4_9HEMI
MGFWDSPENVKTNTNSTRSCHLSTNSEKAYRMMMNNKSISNSENRNMKSIGCFSNISTRVLFSYWSTYRWNTMVCTGCCATLDHIVTYLFKQLSQKGKKTRRGVPVGNDVFLQVLELHPEILQQILSTVLNVIMFEDCRNQWSMSRPLLGLILLNEEYFNQLRENIIRSQPPDKQGAMAQWFENLMDSIERNLLTKNRDRFTQNLSMFRRDINDSLKGPNMTNSPNDMMTS